MPTIIEPGPADYEPEHRHRFAAADPAGEHVVVQGSAYFGDQLHGKLDDDEDESDETYDVWLLVGPLWAGDVQTVVPQVTVNGFYNGDSDDDDQQRWDIRNLTWDTIGELGPNQDEVRIRLRFEVAVRGQSSRVERIGYYLIARARQLGNGGVTAPGPIKGKTDVADG